LFNLIMTLAAVGAVSWLAYKLVTADGRVDYCQIDRYGQGYVLVGHVPWRFNRVLYFAVPTDGPPLDATFAYAKKIGCEIR